MIQWRMGANNSAVAVSFGRKVDGRILSTGAAGCLIYGPYLDLPAGELRLRFTLGGGGAGAASVDLAADDGGQVLACQRFDLAEIENGQLELVYDNTVPLSRAEVRLWVDEDTQIAVTGLEIDAVTPSALPPAIDRPVGEESSKTFAEKVRSGFTARYLSGPSILEIGFRGYRDEVVVPIVPQAIGVDIGYPGYDGRTLPFADCSVDAIYTSHCLEHISDYRGAFADWYRLLKIGGFLVIAVPHQYLFEKQALLPSVSNIDHKRYYTPESLLAELRESWPEHSYRIRQLIENDAGFDYSRFPEEPSPGCYEIEVVIEKIEIPTWRLADGSVRAYGAVEFQARGPQRDRWSIDLDFNSSESCKVWGPYARLVPADYEAIFHFDGDFQADRLLDDMALDVAVNRNPTEIFRLSGEDGARRLKSGAISVPFSVTAAAAHVEFRIHAEGRPVDGRLVFKGVEVRFRRRS